MTPEEHIERAEWLLNIPSPKHTAIAAAAVHVAIADHKKRYPSDAGRPIRYREA